MTCPVHGDKMRHPPTCRFCREAHERDPDPSKLAHSLRPRQVSDAEPELPLAMPVVSTRGERETVSAVPISMGKRELLRVRREKKQQMLEAIQQHAGSK